MAEAASVVDARARLPFGDDAARRWIEYRPRPRPGVSLAELDGAGRKAAYRLLATGLSPSAFAQALAIVALEEVLDRAEGGRRGRRLDDYRVAVFGTPGGADPWSWRFEGHHLSVSMTVVGSTVSPAPVFFGANPARVEHAGHTVSRPLAPEEDVALALLSAVGPAAVIAPSPPADILSGRSPRVSPLSPAGVPAAAMPLAARTLLAQLAAVYLARLPEPLASSFEVSSLSFAWAGPVTPGLPQYYRVQGPGLLIEYDNTGDGNHAHTVLRRPSGDFGEDVLARHRAGYHGGGTPAG